MRKKITSQSTTSQTKCHEFAGEKNPNLLPKQTIADCEDLKLHNPSR